MIVNYSTGSHVLFVFPTSIELCAMPDCQGRELSTLTCYIVFRMSFLYMDVNLSYAISLANQAHHSNMSTSS
jgi:hypothetical protein